MKESFAVDKVKKFPLSILFIVGEDTEKAIKSMQHYTRQKLLFSYDTVK